MTCWFDKRTISLGRDQFVSPLWHCFGVSAEPSETVDVWGALRMLLASRTWLLPLNTHGDTPIVGYHEAVAWERFSRYAIAASCVPCLNVNLQVSSEEAIYRAKRAFSGTGVDLFKLEVLTSDGTDSNDAEVMLATRNLVASGFRVMPLVSSRAVEFAEELDRCDAVPVVRVMGSPIGSGKGILDGDAVREFAQHETPVVLDGGIGCARDVADAMGLGCAGFLVNSMLFRDGAPDVALRDLRRELAAFDFDSASDREIWEEQFNRAREAAA